MRPIVLLLTYGALLSVARAQPVPARRALAINDTAIGRKFIRKSKPYDSTPKRPPMKSY